VSVVFGCRGCGLPVEGEPGGEVVCRRCETKSTLRPAPEELDGCLGCGCPELYRHRDFSQKMGLLMIAIGVVLSLALVSFLPLVVAALVDLALYLILPDVAVCYACKSRRRARRDAFLPARADQSFSPFFFLKRPPTPSRTFPAVPPTSMPSDFAVFARSPPKSTPRFLRSPSLSRVLPSSFAMSLGRTFSPR
jgi:hypothetical protein